MFPLSQPAELITTQDQALLPQDSVQVFPWELCSAKPGSKKLLPKANHLYENPQRWDCPIQEAYVVPRKLNEEYVQTNMIGCL